MNQRILQDKKRNAFNMGLLYLNYWIKAKNRHGAHSPFLYKLLTNCINKRISAKDFDLIEKQRKRLRRDKRKIETCDFGATDVFGKPLRQSRKISDIARKSLKSHKQASLIFKLAEYFQCNNILELGTCFGVTTSYISKARPCAVVDTIEGCQQRANIAKDVFELLDLQNVNLHIGKIDELLLPILKKSNSPDLVFVDANHSEAATIKYFNILLDYINDDTVIIFDDIYWSKGMEKAWNEIIEHPKVAISVDLFFMGLVFFKQGLSKEKFIVRY